MQERSIKALLIEDDPEDLLLFRNMLRRQQVVSFDVTTAGSFQEAVERLKTTPVDVVLLDLSLPDSQGKETFTALRKIVPSSSVIVVLTGLDDEAVALDLVRGGAQDYLVKGKVDADLLVRAIRYAFERKEAHDELIQTAEELAISNRELTQFAHITSHDLQEPLRSISSFCQLLQKHLEGKLDELGRGYLERVIAGARRMEELIGDLLQYSSARKEEDSGRESTDVAASLSRVLTALETAVAESGAAISHGELPTVAVDPLHVERLLQNLLANAMRYRRQEALQIDISTERQDDQWLFAVSDNGLGIPHEHLEDIFVVFRRLHTRDEYPGTGIGLSICRKIAELYGGRIWVESEVGKGSTFFFLLPALEGEQ